MPHYMLLLHENPVVFADVSPSEMQAIIQRYAAWATKLATEGRLVSSSKLQDETGRSLRTANGRITVTEGPYTEAREVIGGYFMIKADNYDHAVELSQGCPHIDFGVVEIRQTDPVSS